ncbi:MAG: hypothetical protein ACK5ZS_01555 [bacterium]|jgi:hypothetical protein
MTTISALAVTDYSQNYGGVPVMIDGRECLINSVGEALSSTEVELIAA